MAKTLYTDAEYKASIVELLEQLTKAIVQAAILQFAKRGFRDYEKLDNALRAIHKLHAQHYAAWHEEHHI